MNMTCGEHCVRESETGAFAELNAYWNSNEVLPELAGPDRRMIGRDTSVLPLVVLLLLVDKKKNLSSCSSISRCLTKCLRRKRE